MKEKKKQFSQDNHSTTSQCSYIDAINNGDCPRLSYKLISAPEISKHLTTSHCPLRDAANNIECPSSSHKLISAPEVSKHLVLVQISICVM
jgi:hypothetical protein